jgi:pimeloyl-ACP methyl ester carboxylesterase
MIASLLDSLLAGLSSRRPGEHTGQAGGKLAVRTVDTPVGAVRVHDSGSPGPCVVFVPDGPNVIEHYEHLIGLLSPQLRVVCFDMPGFGYSFPKASYGHALDQGAGAVIGVLDQLGIKTATLAFSCANGFYDLRAAQIAPERISRLILSQTPSLTAMHAWTARMIPRPLRIPVIGQIVAWSLRRKLAHGWYKMALPKTSDAAPFQKKAVDALAGGGCFCLAGVVQGLAREKAESLKEISIPCTVIWGSKDRSHKHTDPQSILEYVPGAEIRYFQDCGHFPDVEEPERFAEVLLDLIVRAT